MNRLLKFPFKVLWRMTAPVRRPLVRRLEALLTRCCSPTYHLNNTNICHVTEESNLLMDHMVRELVRLQKQVDQLHHAVEDITHSGSHAALAVVSDRDDRHRSVAG